MSYPKPNYTQIPNVLLDEHLSSMAESELKVVLAIARKTFGWHKEQARLSLTHLEELTGLSRQGVINGVERGIERGVIARKRDGKQGYFYHLLVNEVDQLELPTSQRSRLALVNEVDQLHPVFSPVSLGSKESIKEKIHYSADAQTHQEEEQPQETEFVFTNQEDPNDALLSPSQPSKWVGKREGPTPLPPSPQRKEKARPKPQGNPESDAAWKMYLAKLDQHEPGCVKNHGKERKATNAMVAAGWTAEQIGQCFDIMKADDWWADKHLSAQSMSSQIGAKLNGKATGSRNGERNFSLALAFGEEEA